jgi:hypothetical protein
MGGMDLSTAVTLGFVGLVLFLAVVVGIPAWLLWRYVQIWRWTVQLAVKFRLFSRRPRPQQAVVVVGHTLTPERGAVIPMGVAVGTAGKLIPSRMILLTGLGLDPDDLEAFGRHLNFHTGELYNLRQVPSTRFLVIKLAPRLPDTAPAPDTATALDEPWMVPFAQGRTGPLSWQTDDMADPSDDPNIIDSTHFLNIARTGFGKTRLVLAAILAHCDRWPKHWSTVLLDPKGTFPGRSIRTLDDRVAKLKALAGEIEEAAVDNESGKLDYQDRIAQRGRTLVVVDELPELMTKPLPSNPDKRLIEEAQHWIMFLANRGREPGYHLVGLGTNGRIAAIGHVRDSFDLRYGGWLDNNQWRVLFDETPPRKLPRRRGLGWVTTNDGLAEAQAYPPAPATRRLKAVS